MNNQVEQTDVDKLAFAMTGYRLQDTEYLLKIANLDKMPEDLEDWLIIGKNKKIYNLVAIGKLLYSTIKVFLEKRNTQLTIPDWINCEVDVKLLILLKIKVAVHLRSNSSYKDNFRNCGDALHNYMIDLKRLDGWQASDYYDPIDKVDTWICKLSQSQNYLESQTVFNTVIQVSLDEDVAKPIFATIDNLISQSLHLYRSIHSDDVIIDDDVYGIYKEIIALMIASKCLMKIDGFELQSSFYKSKIVEFINRSYLVQIKNGDIIGFIFNVGDKDSKIHKKSMFWDNVGNVLRIEINQFISKNASTD